MSNAADLLSADTFASELGARLVSVGGANVDVELDVDERHLDGAGRIAGGVLFSLADCAMSLVSNADGDAVAIATHFAQLHSRCQEGIERLAVSIRAGFSGGDGAVTWMGVVTGDGKPVASFTGTTLRLR